MQKLYDVKAPKKETNLSLNNDLLKRSKALDINLSATLEQALKEKLAKVVAIQWLEENMNAIKAYNEFVNENGYFTVLTHIIVREARPPLNQVPWTIISPCVLRYPMENNIFRISTEKFRSQNYFRHSYPLAHIYAHPLFGCLRFSGQPDAVPIPDATDKAG